MKSIVLIALFAFAVPVLAQESTAASAQAACSHWWNLHTDHKKNVKGTQEDVYQTGGCFGYFQGLIDGMDGTGFTGDSGALYVFHIKRESINSLGDVITAFCTHLQQNPLDRGKPAWKILQNVLIENRLAGFEQNSTVAESITH